MRRIELTMDYGAMKRGLSRLLKKANKDGAVHVYIPVELAANICIALEHLGTLKKYSNEGMLWKGEFTEVRTPMYEDQYEGDEDG